MDSAFKKPSENGESSQLIPITTTQNLILTGQLLQPRDPLYNMIMVYRIEGDISVDCFRAAFLSLIENCDAMRLVFLDINTVPKQQCVQTLDYDFTFLDFSGKADPYAHYKEWEESRKSIVFDLTKCLFDSSLIKLSSNDYIWYFNQHHLATDAWSTELTYKFVKNAYTLAKNDAINKVDVMPSYADYAQFEKKKAGSKQFTRATQYWRKQLDKTVPSVKFYRDLPRNRSTTTLRYHCDFGEERTEKLRHLLKNEQFMAFSTDLGLMQLIATMLFGYLHRISGNERLSIGTPCHSRTTQLSKETAGLLINIFPLQIDVDDNESFLSLYQKIAQSNQELLINAVPGANQAAHNNTFDVVLNYITSSFGDFDGFQTKTDWVHPDSGDRNHLMRLQVQNFDNESAISLFFDLNKDAFTEGDAQLVRTHFLCLVDAFFDDPTTLLSQPPLISNINDQVINHYKRVDSFPSGSNELEALHQSTLLSIWDESWRKHQHDTALVLAEHSMSFSELNRLSDKLAAYLLNRQLISDNAIALYMDRSINAVITILGIMKAGGSFLPIDVQYPQSRLDYILSDAQVTLIIADSEYSDALAHTEQTTFYIDQMWDSIDSQETISSLPTITPDSRAYVIYTSGSTGHPKGVEINHKGLHNYLSWAKDYYCGDERLDFPLFSSLSFDLTITSLFLPLISGAKLIIYPESNDGSTMAIRDVIEDNRVDIIKLTPAHLTLIQNMDFSVSTLQKLIVGGDDFKVETAQSFNKYFAGNIELYNEYGPTEATVACSVHCFDPESDLGASVPIGRPIDNAFVYVLDKHLHGVPQGVVGEIYIAGIGLAKGYLHNPELTQERFIYHPSHPQLRLYKTGDLATYNEHGVLEYLGRNDHQVKIRGVRIETGEIESAMLGIDNVKDVIVDLATRFGLDDADEDVQLAVEHCKKCGIAANHPSAQLDKDSICRICRIYEKQSDLAQAYYQDLPTLQAWIDRIKARKHPGKQDSIMLLSGGKDSSYTLCKLVDMGLTPLVFTLDNGYISDGAKANIKRLVDRLGLELVVGETDAMDDIFVDSLTRFSNVCNGCFKTIYTMSMKLAKERGISVICTGLSRGQIFETRVAHLFQQGCFSPDKIDERIIEARKAYHRTDDIISRRLDVTVFQDDEIFEQVQYLDYFRYTDVTLDEMYDYLNNIAPWIRPSDTGRSTNCLINDAGIYVHKKERGYHNYALPYSWDVRLGHKERDAALEELDDEIDQQKVDDILKQVGYQPQKPNNTLSRENALVAYYSGPSEIQKNTLQSQLAINLPKEYIPTQFIWLKELPLTANGKINRDALPKPQQSTRDLSVDYIAPSTEVETALATLWQKLLGVKEVGIADNFFDLGGDSIVNIQIVAAARESGIDISPQQVFDYPSIQALAEVAGKISQIKADQNLVTGRCELLPAQARFFETMTASNINVGEHAENAHAKSVLLAFEKDYSLALLQRAFHHLLTWHDGLRACFTRTDSTWQQEILSEVTAFLSEVAIDNAADKDEVIKSQRDVLIEQLDISTGKVIAASMLVDQTNNQKYLLIVIHYLVIDGLSWWVLLGDLATICQQIANNQAPKLPAKSSSLVQYTDKLSAYLNSPNIKPAKDYWQNMLNVKVEDALLRMDSSSGNLSITLSEKDTQLLSHEVPLAYNMQVQEVLLAALNQCMESILPHLIPQQSQKNDERLLVDIEEHSRESILEGIDTMRTVGCFTIVFPVLLTPAPTDKGQLLKRTKEQLRAVPNKGLDFDLLRYLPSQISGNSTNKHLSTRPSQALLDNTPAAKVLFNYMGKWQRKLDESSPFTFCEPVSSYGRKDALNTYALSLSMIIFDEQLRIELNYDDTHFDAQVISQFAKHYKQTISEFIQYCIDEKGQGATPSDFPSANIDQDDLEDLFAEFGED